MKKLALLLSALLFIVIFQSCTSSTSTEIKKEEQAEKTSKTADSKEASKPSVVCKQEEKQGDGEPVLIKSCQYGNIQTKSEGYPDMKGRYSYTYEISLNGKKVKNEAIFNDKLPELLSKLNEKILKDYAEFYNAEDTKDCFEGMNKEPKFALDQMGIDFDDNKIIFNISFGLSGACMSVDGTAVSMSLDEIENYLKK